MLEERENGEGDVLSALYTEEKGVILVVSFEVFLGLIE